MRKIVTVVLPVCFAVSMISGCSGDPPKPTGTLTPQENPQMGQPPAPPPLPPPPKK